jgi:hypothetical protein
MRRSISGDTVGKSAGEGGMKFNHLSLEAKKKIENELFSMFLSADPQSDIHRQQDFQYSNACAVLQ